MHQQIIDLALKEAKQAFLEKEIPVGAVLFKTKSHEILCSAHNLSEQKKNPLLHAEMLVLEKGFRALQKKTLEGYSLFVSLEPCSMCASALSLARLDRIYFAAYDPKTGGVEQGCCVFNQATTHHKPEVYGGLCEKEFQTLLTSFFDKLRGKTDES